MFEVGFWELALIGVVALLVVGPDKLPSLARTVGLYVGKIRRMVAQVKDDIEREVQADELRRSMDEAKALRDAAFKHVDAARDEIESASSDMTAGLNEQLEETRRDYEAWSEEESVAPAPPQTASPAASGPALAKQDGDGGNESRGEDHERRPES